MKYKDVSFITGNFFFRSNTVLSQMRTSQEKTNAILKNIYIFFTVSERERESTCLKRQIRTESFSKKDLKIGRYFRRKSRVRKDPIFT